MKHFSKSLFLGLALLLLIPMSSYATPMEKSELLNSDLYSPASIENYDYQGIRKFPKPISEVNYRINSLDRIQFTLQTYNKFSLSVTVIKENSKEDPLLLTFKENTIFDVDIALDPHSNYSISLLLKNADSEFSSAITASIIENTRIIGNDNFELSSYNVQGSYNIMAIGEGEPNDTVGNATSVSNNIDVNGTISSATDFDWFKLEIPVKQKINVFLGNICSTCDYDLYLYQSNGTTLIASSLNGPGSSELISGPLLEKGTYYVRVNAFNGKFSSTQQYLLRWKATQSWPAINTTSANITSHFGPRWGTMHNGTDITRSQEDPIVAAFDGMVTEVGNNSLRGNYVIIDSIVNGQNVQTRYLHMKDLSVLVGGQQNVIAGQRIGTMGTTGDSTGIHLHFETRTGVNAVPEDAMQNLFLYW